jgi:hypothetical protein
MPQAGAVAAADIKDRGVAVRPLAGDRPESFANGALVGQILKEKTLVEQQIVTVCAFLSSSARVEFFLNFDGVQMAFRPGARRSAGF